MTHRPSRSSSDAANRLNDDLIGIFPAPLSLDALLWELGIDASGVEASEDLETGALVTFSGIVRETEGTSRIPRLDYEHYPRMAEKEMARLVVEARQRWPLRRVGLWHRIGAVPVGEPSVLVAVSAGHRAEAFAAAAFLMDELKRSVPIWKAAPDTE